MQKLLGVVMCGGKSQRMGTDKGLIKQGNVTWAQLSYSKIKQLEIPVVVSVNPIQIPAYSTLFNADDLVVDSMDIPGPLNGILSVHALYPEKDILILACDMVDMDDQTLRQLVNTYDTEPGYSYYAYHNGKFFEPLCAIYTAKALSQLQPNLSNYSLQRVLENANVKQLKVADAAAFNNHNSNAV